MNHDTPKIPQGVARRPSDGWVPLRGPSGRLYGYYDPAGQVIEVKRGGAQAERIELSRLVKTHR